MPRISFLIPVYNRPVEVEALLESLRPILDRDDCEFIVVDDGSEEDIAGVLQGKFTSAINFVRLPRQYGAAESKNVGVANADGDLIVQLDSDTVVPNPHNLVELVDKKFTADENLGLLAFDVRSFDTGDTQNISDVEPESDVKTHTFVGAGAAFRRTLFEAVGGYPGEFFIYREESALSLKMIDAGYDIVLTPDVTVRHKGVASGNPGKDSVYYQIRNNIWFGFGYLPFPWSFVHTGYWIYQTGTQFLCSKPIPYLLGLFKGVSGIPKIKRRFQSVSRRGYRRYSRLRDGFGLG